MPNGDRNFDSMFGPLGDHDSTPTVPLTDIQKVRFTALATDLQDAKIQAYVETNFGIQALNLLRAVVPMIAGLV